MVISCHGVTMKYFSLKLQEHNFFSLFFTSHYVLGDRLVTMILLLLPGHFPQQKTAAV